MRKVYHKIIRIAGNVITVEADDVAYNELAEVSGLRGVSLAQVIRLDGRRVSLQVFAGSRGIGTDDEVRFLGREMQVSGSDALLGRVFNGRGAARDNRPDITEELIDIGTPSVNPAKRVIPRHMIRTNIPMIDIFNTLVESQKLPIFSVAGEPYNELLSRIALQAQVDVIVLGGMGLKHDDYLTFKRTVIYCQLRTIVRLCKLKHFIRMYQSLSVLDFFNSVIGYSGLKLRSLLSDSRRQLCGFSIHMMLAKFVSHAYSSVMQVFVSFL